MTTTLQRSTTKLLQKRCGLDFITTISSVKFTTNSYKPGRESNPGLKISYYAGRGHPPIFSNGYIKILKHY